MEKGKVFLLHNNKCINKSKDLNHMCNQRDLTVDTGKVMPTLDSADEISTMYVEDINYGICQWNHFKFYCF